MRYRRHNTGTDEPIILTPDDVGRIIPTLHCPQCDAEALRFEMRLVGGDTIEEPARQIPVMACQAIGCDFEEYGVPA